MHIKTTTPKDVYHDTDQVKFYCQTMLEKINGTHPPGIGSTAL